MRRVFESPLAKFFLDGGAALLLGLTVGLERERSAHEEKHVPFAGIRTFPIASLAGFLCATLGGNAILVTGLATVTALAVAAFMRAGKDGHPGVTTEAAFVLTYLLGAGCGRGMILESASTALVVTVLLARKDQLRRFAQRLPDADLAAALKFGVISLVILPVIPNRPLGSGWWAINLHTTWLMVVLITGIGFAGYILTRLVGPQAGTGLAGLVGGLVSSTAVTLSFSRRSREEPSLSAACALAILAACAVLWVRIAVEATVVNPEFALVLAAPVGGLVGVALLGVALAWRHASVVPHTGETKVTPVKNPVALRPAIMFAAAFAVVTIAVRFTQAHLGVHWTYAAAFLSGLHEMDAVTLSMAGMAKSGAIAPRQGAVAVLIAAGANTIVKMVLAAVLGSPATRRIVAIGLGSTVFATAGAIALVLVA